LRCTHRHEFATGRRGNLLAERRREKMTRFNTQVAEKAAGFNSALGTIFTTVAIALAGFLAFATFTAV
jgi:hypothetical protein